MNKYITFGIVCSLAGIFSCGSEDVATGGTPPESTPDSTPSLNDIDDFIHEYDNIIDDLLPDPANDVDAGDDIDTNDGTEDAGQTTDQDATTSQDTGTSAGHDSGGAGNDAGSTGDHDSGSSTLDAAGSTSGSDAGDVKDCGSGPPVHRCTPTGYKNYGHCVAACAHRCLGSKAKSDGQECFKPCKATCKCEDK